MPGRNKRKLSGGLQPKNRSKVIRSSSVHAAGGHDLSLSQADNSTANQMYTGDGRDNQADLISTGSQRCISQGTSQSTSSNTHKGYTILCKHCTEEINMSTEDSEISHLQCCICDNFHHEECLSCWFIQRFI